MRNFKLKEFYVSDTAKKNKIDNIPPKEIIDNISELVDNLLDPLRDAWFKKYKSGIKVNSGYRCKELNKAVGGVENSAHLTGYAADLVPINGRRIEFIKFCQEWIKDKEFDQCINEHDRWCHIGYKRNDGKQRKMIFRS